VAFFGVTKEIIEESKPHPNADRLDLTKVTGMSFQFVTGKGTYKPGDLVLHFPLDSLIPDGLAEKLGVKGLLAGKDKNRVKTVRLRSELSMGLLGSFEKLLPEEKRKLRFKTEEDEGKFFANHFGVTKYEPPITAVKGGIHGGNLGGLPCNLGIYDIEGADRYAEALAELMDQRVWITEKVEGTNGSWTYSVLDQKFYANTRKHTVLPSEDVPKPPYWKLGEMQGLFQLLENLTHSATTHVTLYGEVLGGGIQGNIYRLKEPKVLLFDIKVDNLFIRSYDFFTLKRRYSFESVPLIEKDVVLREWLDGRTIQEASNGVSFLGDGNTRREGIVIKPSDERYSPLLHGRLILKQRSPEYLLKEKN